MITDYHAKLFAHELSRRHSVADAEKLAGALLDAQVDLDPPASKSGIMDVQAAGHRALDRPKSKKSRKMNDNGPQEV